jgi:class 3 adenylate cyclase
MTPPCNAQAPDLTWTFDHSGTTDYRLDSAPLEVYGGSFPALDPTLDLVIGKRYQIVLMDPVGHPIEIIAKGPNAGSDVVLLSLADTGPFESDAAVAWVEDSTSVTLTLTQALVDAMQQTGLVPGYRCGVHTSFMRGNFTITTPSLVEHWDLY